MAILRVLDGSGEWKEVYVNGKTPTIGPNGNWFVDGIDTGKPSKGNDSFEVGNEPSENAEIWIDTRTDSETPHIPDIKQELGTSKTDVMSQEAVSKSLEFVADKDGSNGMARINLRKNGGILTQKMLPTANTIYIIQYNYDLNDQTITVPEGSILKFEGGSFSNGTLRVKNNNSVVGTGEKLNKLKIEVEYKTNNLFISNLELIGEKVFDENSSINYTSAISCTGSGIIHNCFINNCKIHGFNKGIKLNGSNIIIKNNLFYNNGTKADSPLEKSNIHDAEYDMYISGQGVEISGNNIVIRENRCLSYQVDRNIDVGALKAADNIIIGDNICSSSTDINTEVFGKNAYKRHCIMVGYAGTETDNTIVNITNNICKGSSWSGIYVRADNQESTDVEKSACYIANISNNYIEHVYKKEHFIGAAIAIELRNGSIISNNIIKNCTEGIIFSMIYSNNYTKVCNNTIENISNRGISQDSVCYNFDIDSNYIKNAKVGISSFEIIKKHNIADLYKKYINIKNNIIYLKEEQLGIDVDNCYTDNILISNNTIVGYSSLPENQNNKGIRIKVATTREEYHIYNIIKNTISNLDIGIDVFATSDLRNYGRNIDFNTLVKCKTAIKVAVNSNKQLFIVHGNTYKDCESMFGDQSWSNCVFEGLKNEDETFEIIDDRGTNFTNSKYGYLTKAPVCFLPKLFKKGDKIISRLNYFNYAICKDDYSIASDSGSKWFVEGANLNNKTRGICETEGQVIFNKESKKLELFNNTTWVNVDGTPLT